jgi:methylated-DNA-protein-cysteine methyltransferase-like protein
MSETKYQLIYNSVYQIPRGRVATYGQIAALCGFPGQARQVGYALACLQEPHDVPWQRVVNARGCISLRAAGEGENIQRSLLEAEGVCFDQRGVIDLNLFQWRPTG